MNKPDKGTVVFARKASFEVEKPVNGKRQMCLESIENVYGTGLRLVL